MVLDWFAVVVAGLLVGNELAVAVFVNPALHRLRDEAHLPAAAALAGVLGRWMPWWYGLAAQLLWVEAWVRRWPGLLLGSAAVWTLVIVYTVSALVPLNNRIAALNAPGRGAEGFDWKLARRRWDALHRVRVVLLAAAYGLLVAGVLRFSGR